MAHAQTLPEDILDSVADQLGSRLAEFNIAGEGVAEMVDTLPIWLLGADDLLSKRSNDLAEIVTPTGRWHHQIHIQGDATAFARSMPLGQTAGSWTVTEIFRSDIAGRIGRALSWIEDHAEGDPEVRLLIAPAFHLHACWLTSEDGEQVVVADAPREVADLETNTLYNAEEFLERLRRGNAIIGLTY